MRSVCAVLLLSAAFVVGGAVAQDGCIALSNDLVEVGFSNTTGDLCTLSAKEFGSHDLVVSPTPGYIWEVLLAGETAQATLNAAGCSPPVVAVPAGTSSSATFTWSKCAAPSSLNQPATLTVNMAVSLGPSSYVADLDFTFAMDDVSLPVAVWSVKVGAGGVTGNADDEWAFPSGYGTTGPMQTGVGTHGNYPSSSATMQFVGVGGGAAVNGTSLYFASHDSEAWMKTLGVQSTSSVSDSVSEEVAALRLCATLSNPIPVKLGSSAMDTLEHLHCRSTESSAVSASSAWIQAIIPGAGQPQASVKFPTVAVGVATSTPVWYGASQVYSEWVKSAPWRAAGPVSSRKDMPTWYTNNSLWVNTGWQCHDVFNDTQGDPAVVQDRGNEIRNRFGMDYLMHWYEWQQGNGTERFKFDTHYPDYNPPRQNFSQAVKNLTAAGVSILPYINGRIFDINSDSYLYDNGSAYCTQNSLARWQSPASARSYYEESYGSGATFHVADPSTTYWKTAISDVVKSLADDGCPGTYIDQLGAAAPTPDWMPAHGHFGGGGWWSAGLNDMVDQSRSASGGAVLVTESNAEPLMSSINGYLTLVAFRATLAGSGGDRFVNMFTAVHGGYFVGFGAEFSQSDMVPDPNVLTSKVAHMLVNGAQMGWWSLGGVTSGPNYDHSCGPMGMYDLFMDSKYDSQMSFISSLASLRHHLTDYVVDGRIVRPVTLSPPPTTFTSPGNTINKGPYPAVPQALWYSPTTKSLLFMAVAATSSVPTTTFEFALNLADYPMIPSSPSSFTATVISPDGTRAPASGVTVTPGMVKVAFSFSAASPTYALELSPQ